MGQLRRPPASHVRTQSTWCGVNAGHQGYHLLTPVPPRRYCHGGASHLRQHARLRTRAGMLVACTDTSARGAPCRGSSDANGSTKSCRDAIHPFTAITSVALPGTIAGSGSSCARGSAQHTPRPLVALSRTSQRLSALGAADHARVRGHASGVTGVLGRLCKAGGGDGRTGADIRARLGTDPGRRLPLQLGPGRPQRGLAPAPAAREVLLHALGRATAPRRRRRAAAGRLSHRAALACLRVGGGGAVGVAGGGLVLLPLREAHKAKLRDVGGTLCHLARVVGRAGGAGGGGDDADRRGGRRGACDRRGGTCTTECACICVHVRVDPWWRVA